MSKTRVLTGITTSGTPHLGNYVGAIRPALTSAQRSDVENFYFLADLHALVKCGDPARVQRSTLEIAATWMAGGLDVEKNWFYRQSDIPEIPELTWFLTCVAGKGLLNRAHAYKAAVDKNRADGVDDDAGINAGLFMYPVLMAADILLLVVLSVRWAKYASVCSKSNVKPLTWSAHGTSSVVTPHLRQRTRRTSASSSQRIPITSRCRHRRRRRS